MRNFFLKAVLIITVTLLFCGCASHKIIDYQYPSPSHAAQKKTDVETASQPKKLASLQIDWKCSVGDNKQVWRSEASSLVTAQTKAKRLCALLSKSHGACHYKGCVQVSA